LSCTSPAAPVRPGEFKSARLLLVGDDENGMVILLWPSRSPGAMLCVRNNVLFALKFRALWNFKSTFALFSGVFDSDFCGSNAEEESDGEPGARGA
jgi:hypothetical protein